MEAVLAHYHLVLRPARGLGLPGPGPPGDPPLAGRARRPAARLGYATTAAGVSFCGAGCTLGDIIAEFAVFGLGATVAGSTLGAEYIATTWPRSPWASCSSASPSPRCWGLSLRKGLIEGAKADVASLAALEIGLFGWMALMFFVFFPAPHLHPGNPGYWFLM